MSISLRTADVLPIAGFSREEFAAWFEDGFRSRASTDREIIGRAFYPTHNLMAVKPVPDRLEEIYWALPDAGGVKSKLREGLAIAFERLARDRDLYPQLSQLLHFAQLIMADELAPRLLGVFTEVGAGAYEERLLFQALTYLSSLPPSAAAPKIIRDLITLPDASPKVAVFAWLTMCRCDPAVWTDHLEALRERISLALEPYPGSNNSITGARFASFMPLSGVAAQLSRLQYQRNRKLAQRADNWLLDALVEQPDAPYKVVRREGILMLAYREDLEGPLEPIADTDAEPLNEIVWFLGHISVELLPTHDERLRIPPKDVQSDIDAVRNLFGRRGSATAADEARDC